MPYDNLPPHDPGQGMQPSEQGRVQKPIEYASIDSVPFIGPLADREVPLPNGRTPVLVHEWLDGEATDVMVRATPGGNDAVDLWTRINDEAEILRTRTTPLYVHKRIMESLPDDVHQVSHPWYRRSVALNPMVLIAAAAALLGIGAIIARVAAH
jgi:hypothetical protein